MSIAASMLESMNENDAEAKAVLRDTLGAMYEGSWPKYLVIAFHARK